MEKVDDPDKTSEKQEDKGIPEHIKLLVDKPSELLRYMNESDAGEKEISSIAWELISYIMVHLKENSPKRLDSFRDCFVKIVEFAKPKEIILGLLEHFDPSTESKHVLLLIPPLANVFKRLLDEDPKTCAILFETAYSTFSYYLESFNLPNYDSFEPNEKSQKVFEAEKIELMMSEIIDVVEPLIKKLCEQKESIDFGSFKKHTFKFLCSLLVILGQVDLDVREGSLHDVAEEQENSSDADEAASKRSITKPHDVLNICHQIMNLSLLLHPPLHLFNTTRWWHLLPDEELSDEGKLEIEKHIERARSCFVFLLLARGVSNGNLPQIYSSHHYLVNTLVSLEILLSCKNQIVILKGINLLTYIMNRTQKLSLSVSEISYGLQKYYTTAQLESFSETNPVKHTFLCLISVATSIPSEGIRKKAVELIGWLLESLLWGDRYSMVVFLLKNVQHTGVLGYIIGYLKNKLDQIIRDDPPDGFESFFNAEKMLALGEIIFTLPCGTETDLLSDSDRIMPALNLLRFLLIRDKENRSGIKSHVEKIDNDFLKPLRTALDLSRAHYRAELKKYEKKRGKNTGPPAGEPDFTVNGMPLPSLPYHKQKQTLESALYSFDMIEIVTVRVTELLEAIS